MSSGRDGVNSIACNVTGVIAENSGHEECRRAADAWRVW